MSPLRFREEDLRISSNMDTMEPRMKLQNDSMEKNVLSDLKQCQCILNIDTLSDAKATRHALVRLSQCLGISSMPTRNRLGKMWDLLQPPPVSKPFPSQLQIEWVNEWQRILRVLIAAEEQSTRPATALLLNQHTIHVRNPYLKNRLKNTYSAQDIRELSAWLQTKGVFEFVVNETNGLIKTSEADENADMIRQWTTDSVMVGTWQRFCQPDLWKKNLLTNAAFILSPPSLIPAIKSIKDPAWTRQKRVDGGFEEMNGIPHLYLPTSVEMDPLTGIPKPDSFQTDPHWFNQKRIESQALLLLALAQNILAGLDPNASQTAPWAFVEKDLANPAVSNLLSDSISILTAYLVAVHTDPHSGLPDGLAPTAGSWEERCYEGGMTWDSALSALALESVVELQTKGTKNLSKPHKSLIQSLQRNRFASLLPDSITLKKTIHACREIVKDRVTLPLQRHQPVKQSPNRMADTSLLFLAAWDYRLDPDPVVNATLHLQLMHQMERELLRDFGMLRYGPHLVDTPTAQKVEIFDSYLGAGFWLPETLRSRLIQGERPRVNDTANSGSTDTSSLNSMVNRQTHTRKGWEAQWSLGPTACLQGLANLGLSLDLAGVNNAALSLKIDLKIDEYINRCLGALTGQSVEIDLPESKSNGYPVASWTVMEAYECVPTLSGKEAWLPGAHPLAWSRAQLWEGLKLAAIGKGK